jgi:Sec7-like guanine-nucleotide exchange factor
MASGTASQPPLPQQEAALQLLRNFNSSVQEQLYQRAIQRLRQTAKVENARQQHSLDKITSTISISELRDSITAQKDDWGKRRPSVLTRSIKPFIEALDRFKGAIDVMAQISK